MSTSGNDRPPAVGEAGGSQVDERWFYRRDGIKRGPFEAEALRQMALSGDLLLTDEVWRPGMPEWLPAAAVEELIPKYVVATRKLVETPGNPGRWRRRVLAALCLTLGAASVWVWLPKSRLSYRRVSGSVTYADGTVMPVDGLTVRFHSLVRARDAETLPPVGVAKVDRATGTFSHATTRFYADGLLAGEHKVTLHVADDQPVPESVASTDCSDIERTILRVNTKDSPLKILVDRP